MIELKKVSILVLSIILIAVSCQSVKEYEEDNLGDLDFTVVEDEDVPEILMIKIEEAIETKEPFKFSYSDGEYLYIIIGYGEQETGGYSIQVKDFYKSQDHIVIETELLGPTKEDMVTMSLTYPYIVVKTIDLGMSIRYK